jgi:hypothetical protein
MDLYGHIIDQNLWAAAAARLGVTRRRVGTAPRMAASRGPGAAARRCNARPTRPVQPAAPPWWHDAGHGRRGTRSVSSYATERCSYICQAAAGTAGSDGVTVAGRGSLLSPNVNGSCGCSSKMSSSARTRSPSGTASRSATNQPAPPTPTKEGESPANCQLRWRSQRHSFRHLQNALRGPSVAACAERKRPCCAPRPVRRHSSTRTASDVIARLLRTACGLIDAIRRGWRQWHCWREQWRSASVSLNLIKMETDAADADAVASTRGVQS